MTILVRRPANVPALWAVASLPGQTLSPAATRERRIS